MRDGCEPLRLISIVPLLLAAGTVCAAAPATAATSPPVAAIACLRVIMSVSFGRTSDPCVILRSSMAIAYARSGELRQVVELSYNLQRSRSPDRVDTVDKVRNRLGEVPEHLLTVIFSLGLSAPVAASSCTVPQGLP